MSTRQPIRRHVEIEASYLLSGPRQKQSHDSGENWEAYLFAQRISEYRSGHIGRRNFIHTLSGPTRRGLWAAMRKWIRAEKVIVVKKREPQWSRRLA